MNIHYASPKVKEDCTDLAIARRKYGVNVAKKLSFVIKTITTALNLQVVVRHPVLRFHEIQGHNIYAVDLGRQLVFRLLLRPIDAQGNPCSNTEIYGAAAIEIIDVRVEGVSKHYTEL